MNLTAPIQVTSTFDILNFSVPQPTSTAPVPAQQHNLDQTGYPVKLPSIVPQGSDKQEIIEMISQELDKHEQEIIDFDPIEAAFKIDIGSKIEVKTLPTPSNKSNLSDVELTDALKDRYSKLFQDGFLVNLHVSVWGMCANLSEEDLKLDHKVSKLIKLGKKMLIDPEHLNEFKNMESKARRFLYRNSYDFPIADAHFVPKKRLADILTKLEEFKGEFFALVNQFVDNYDTYKEAILANEDYVDIVEVIRPLYPTQDIVREKFGFSLSVFELAMPNAFSETNIQELIGRDEAKEEVKTALKEQLKSQHENSLQLLERFTEDAAIALRSKLVSVCKTITNKISNKELISKANLNTIREEIENFRSLNFLDDTEVEKQIASLETLLAGNHNFKTDQEAIEGLNIAVTNILTKAENISDVADISGKYFRKIKV